MIDAPEAFGWHGLNGVRTCAIEASNASLDQVCYGRVTPRVLELKTRRPWSSVAPGKRNSVGNARSCDPAEQPSAETTLYGAELCFIDRTLVVDC